MTKLEVINLALLAVNCDPIDSLDSTDDRAQVMLRAWPLVYGAELRRHNWSFNIKNKALTLAGTQSDLALYTYNYPIDCYNIIKVYVKLSDYDNTIKEGHFSIKASEDNTTKLILTELQSAYCLYLSDAEESTLWTPDFCELLTYALACKTAYKLTSNLNIIKIAEAKYAQAVDNARLNDLLEQANSLPEDLSTILSRGGYNV